MHERKRGFYFRLNAFLRRICLSCALVVGALFVLWLAFKSHVRDEIRREVESSLAAHYKQYRVTVREARLIEDRGLEIRGLSITSRADNKRLISVDRIVADCNLDVETLLSGEKPQASCLRVTGLKVWAERGPGGSWNVADLWPLPKFGSQPPPVTIEDAAVEIVDQHDGTKRSYNFRHIQLQVTPVRQPASSPGSVAESRCGELEIRGSAVGDHVQSLRFQARFDPQNGAWGIGGIVNGLQLSPQLHAALPCEMRAKLAGVASVSGQMDLKFTAASKGPSEVPDGSKATSVSLSDGCTVPAVDCSFSIEGSLSDGQIIDARLPYRLYDLSANVYLDNQGIRIDDVFARNGSSTLRLSVQRSWEETGPFRLRAEARRLELDRRFVEVLPKEYQALWRKYFPAGTIDADVLLESDGERWKPQFEVQCHDVSFEYYAFPYRMEHSRGKVSLKDDLLSIDIIASAGGQDVTIRGELRNPATAPIGWMDVHCDQPIPIDRKLIAAVIDPKAKAVIRSLQPQGTFAISGRFERLDPAQPKPSKNVTIQLHNCTMEYERFPYPLGMISGTMVWNDRGWFFQNLSGRNDSGYIECEGSWQPTEDGGSLLTLDFAGADVPLADELRLALKPGAQQLWNQLRPRGTVDHLTIGLQYASARSELSLEIKAQKWKRQANGDGRSITLHPEWFPYRLDDVAGTVHYRDGHVQLQGISAVHGETEIGIDGTCDLKSDGNWNVQFSHVVADRVRFDRDLLTALPGELGAAVGKLNFHGDINMKGSISFAGNTGSADSTTAAWNVTLDVENGSVQCGPQLDHMHGELSLAGTSNRRAFYSRGELNFDSMIYKGVQLTQVRGPMYVDASGVVLGAGAEQNVVGRAPRALTANAIGGQLSVDAAVTFSGDSPFHLQASLESIDLTQMAREMAYKSDGIRGKANAVLNLRGNRHGWPSWRGDGSVRLYEADIYEIPVILSLVKFLNFHRPDTTAFTSSEIDFRIQGEHLYLDRINFNGDAISLKGYGEMNLDRQIDLKFYALMGRGELPLPALRALLRQASRHILLIQATGSLEKPHFTKEPLPMLRETLDQIFPEPTGGERFSRLPPLTPSAASSTTR